MYNKKEYMKEYVKRNREKLRAYARIYYKIYDKSEERKQYFKKYREEHREDIKKYYERNKETLLAKKKIYGKNNRQKRNEYIKKRLQTNLQYKLRLYLSNRMRAVLKKNRKTSKTIDLLGCNIESFKQYLEKQFESGMNWDNHGQWHIDHIKPCAKFDLSKIEEQQKCFHYTNLQPLWAKENLSMQDKIKD